MTDNGSLEGHKRSGSSFAKSILHRDRSKPESQDGDTLSVSSSSGDKRGRSPLRRMLSKKDPREEATSSKGQLSVPTASSTAALSANMAPPIKQDESKTIEQSVKMFKIFDVLRNGDISAITQAVKDCTEGKTSLQGTTILHLAVQCAQPTVIEQVIVVSSENKTLDLNAQDKDGNTPLHLAALLGRPNLVRILLAQHTADSSMLNYQGRSALDLAKTPEIFQQLQFDRAVFTEKQVKHIHHLVAKRDYDRLEQVLADSRIMAALDVNGAELASDPITVETGGSLLHEATRKKDSRLIQLLLLNGADPFRRDRKGKLPQDITKDDKTKAILKKSPAATAAQRGIQEKAILGGTGPDNKPGGKESREIKGYLKKWTNYTSGYKLRWFVLEDGVLSYYKHQDDAGSACRGAMNMRIAKLSMDAQDKTRFEIHGKSSIKYHLKANHSVEAKRWFWALNNAIQWAKDEVKEEQRAAKDAEAARLGLTPERTRESTSFDIGSRSLAPSVSHTPPSGLQSTTSLQPSLRPAISVQGDEASVADSHDQSVNDFVRVDSRGNAQNVPGDPDDDDDYGDDVSSHEMQPAPKDAFNITAHSANLQLELLSQVSNALQAKAQADPSTNLGHTEVTEALTTYEGAVNSLKGMVGDLLKIARDRDSYWQYRLDREVDLRRLWEDSMAKVAKEQEELEGRIGESEEKRKRTKKALKEALEESTVLQDPGASQEGASLAESTEQTKPASEDPMRQSITSPSLMKRSTITALENLSDSESDDEEFFDAVGAGAIPAEQMPKSPKEEIVPAVQFGSPTAEDSKLKALEPSFKGYEDPVRTRLKLDADDRLKISLWAVLKSMIGKDMTKMTLPVSFNEPTSLLQRVAEDMEYSDLLDVAAERDDSTERMVYVAAFAASEYASTTGRVAKPFNPMLGETFEYARPDKGYRFFLEQVSHHPPIGALWAESSKWDYWGESNVKSKFTGKSFDINHLGTWFLKLRSKNGLEELYTWKKASQSVVGIITGSPVVDNYGPMRIKNHNTGEECQLDFKPRGWKASSAYQVSGKIVDAAGNTKWSLGGRWNDKLFARATPGFDALVDSPANQAFLIWQAHLRPPGIPFNLTPFVVTLNAIPEKLKPNLPRTDTRLRPDQRAMEDGEYDFAASEKSRVEEKQRAKRRERERSGEVWSPRWFKKAKDKTTGEEYWLTNGEYWKNRESVSGGGQWENVEDIF